MEVPGDIGDLLDDYIESTNSMLEELEKAAMAYEAAIRQAAGAPDQGSAATIRRILHKIKGESGMVGIDAMSEFCHQAEYAFEELDPKHRPDMLLRFKDWVCAALQSIRA
jgi:chemotaxis protein histidine kinase CheA